MLLLALALYVLATAAGAGQGDGDASSPQGLPRALGRVLVLPASASDVETPGGACGSRGALVVPAGGACEYPLRSGFLGKRLRLRLAGPGTVKAELDQPRPRVSDTATLDADHATADLTYRESGSRLTLVCAPKPGPTCTVKVG